MGTYPSKRMLEADERIKRELERDFLENVALRAALKELLVFGQEKISLPCKTEWGQRVANQTFQTSTHQSTITTAAVLAHAVPSPYIKCDRDDVYQYQKIN